MAERQPGRRDAADAVATLLAAIESRDLRRIADAISIDCTWQNVPHDPAIGRDDVVAMLAGILGWSDEVRWDVTLAAHSDDTAWLERVDRFWIAGNEHAVRCNGVFSVDRRTGRVTGVRDYVDLGEWRRRIAPVLGQMQSRSPVAVVARHLAAVRSGDPVTMAADYALDAVLDRGEEQHRGWFAIADYFDLVVARLGTRTLRLAEPRPSARGAVVVDWTLVDGTTTAARGSDAYVVDGGRISHQRVTLDGPDF